jgi:hypothetical protein
MINTWVNIIKNKVDVEIDEKDQVEEAIKTKQNAEYALTATTCVHILKTKTPNKFAKVYLVRAETEEIAVEQLKAGNAALTATKDIENKTDELVARDKFEELDVLRQNADDDDNQRQHLLHHTEQARRV